MSFELAAPFPALQATTILPSPRFSNSKALTAEVAIEYAQDGTRYSYVKDHGGSVEMIWQFLLAREKGLELRAFIKSYHSALVQVTDHNGDKWQGNLTNNPFEFDVSGRGQESLTQSVANEKVSVSLEFEGKAI